MPITNCQRIQLKQPEGEPVQAWLVTFEEVLTDFALASLLKAEVDKVDQDKVDKQSKTKED